MTGDTPTPRDLREDAENALRLAAIMPTEEAKEMLLRLAKEFRQRADPARGRADGGGRACRCRRRDQGGQLRRPRRLRLN